MIWPWGSACDRERAARDSSPASPGSPPPRTDPAMITRCFPLVNIPPSSPPRTWVPLRNEVALAVTEVGISSPPVLVCAGGGSKSAREGRSDAVRSGVSVGILGGASVGGAAKQRRPTTCPVNRSGRQRGLRSKHQPGRPVAGGRYPTGVQAPCTVNYTSPRGCSEL